MSEISKEIGQNIRRTRKMRKITHQQLAQAIGKSQSAISKYESGEIAVDIDTLYAIADALQVHIETLLYFPNTATSSSTLKNAPLFSEMLKTCMVMFTMEGSTGSGDAFLNSIRKKMALRRS